MKKNNNFYIKVLYFLVCFTICSIVLLGAFIYEVRHYVPKIQSVNTDEIADYIISQAEDSIELVPAELVRVIDGDTILVKIEEKEVRVRLIGVDAPESVNPDEEKNTEEGTVASEFLKDFLSSYDTVYLQFGREDTDKYGRMLAYVWLTEDVFPLSEDCVREKMLEGVLLSNGMAKVMTIEPNTEYSSIFLKISQDKE